MRYILSKRFEKDFVKLPNRIKIKAIEVLSLFAENPSDRTLHIHPLKGKWVGHYSIDVRGDTRAIYFIIEDGLVRFVTIGSHSQILWLNTLNYERCPPS